MTRILFDRQEDLLSTNLAQVRHRESFLETLLARLAEARRRAPDSPDTPDSFADYDDWYLGVMGDALLSRALVIEYHEWARHVQDLLRDQLSRNGYDSACWDEIKDAAEGGSFVARVRRALRELLDAEVEPDIWAALEELEAVAATLGESTAPARAALAERHPDYFSALDAFGDGDRVGRLMVRPEHLQRAFAALGRFWDPRQGLPHRLSDGAA